MNGYKKVIKSQETRLAILRLLRFVPDKIMIKMQYRIKTGKRLNLKHPKRYTEKLQWSNSIFIISRVCTPMRLYINLFCLFS